MPRAGILLIGIFVAFLITESSSAPNQLRLDDQDESICDKNLDYPVEDEETTDHVPWLEEGIRTGDTSVSGDDGSGQGSVLTEGLQESASEAWKDLKQASMKVANAAKKASQLLEGGKRNDLDMVRLALEDDVEGAKINLMNADAKVRAAMGKPSSEKARASAIALAVASASDTLPSSSNADDRLTVEEDDYDDCDRKRGSKRGKRNRSKGEGATRKQPSRIMKNDGRDDEEEEEEEEEEDNDYDEQSFPELIGDEYRASSQDEGTSSRRAPTITDIISVLQGAQRDLTKVIQSSLDSLLGGKPKASTESTITVTEVDDSSPMASFKKRSDNKYRMEDVKKVSSQIDMFKPLEIVGSFLRNIDQKMIKKLASSIVEPNI